MTDFTSVKLYIYDISAGLASSYGSVLLGKHIDGVWHTGVVVYGREYIFGASGLSDTAPGEVHRQGLVPAPKIVELGRTKKTLSDIQKWIMEKSHSNFRPNQYDVLDWNCNNFSDEFTKYLLDSSTSLMPEEILDLPRFVKTTPLGRMLLAFLNKDPMSTAQQIGSNNNFASNPIHIIPSAGNKNSQFGSVHARQCILPVIDKSKLRISRIEQISKRPLNSNEKEQLNDINQFLIPNATYSPMLTPQHITLLISLMVNSVENESDQIIILEILQLLSEYEHVITIISEIQGQESPIELLRGLREQSEQIQIEFLRWFSSMAATSNGRTYLINIQDDISPLFTEYIQNETISNKIKYEIIVILHNLLCINIDIHLSFMNTISIGSAIVQYMSTPINDHQAEIFLAVFIALADAEKDVYAIAKAMEFHPDYYSSIISCQPLIQKINKKFENV